MAPIPLCRLIRHLSILLLLLAAPNATNRLEAADKPGSSQKIPTAEERVRQSRLFNANLIPTPGLRRPTLSDVGDPLATEDEAALGLLDSLSIADKKATIQSLRRFIVENPTSRWRTALEQRLASCMYDAGFFAGAEEIWESHWKHFQRGSDEFSINIAESGLARLLRLHSSWGSKELLEPLLASLSTNRTFGAQAQLAIERAHETLWYVEHAPAQNILCGPVAVYAIKAFLGQDHLPVDLDFISGDAVKHGINALEVLQTCKEVDLKYQIARRPPEQKTVIPTPCVVHYRANHYAAILDRRGDMYLLEDRPLDFQRWVSSEAIDELASGVFLIPAGALPKGWSRVSEKEARRTYGRHCAHNREADERGVTDHNDEEGNPCGGRGMPWYSFHSSAVSLIVRDTPIGYTPPVGPGVNFTISYKQRDDSQEVAAYRPYGHLGANWSHSFLSFIESDDITNILGRANGSRIRVALPGGGAEYYDYSKSLGRFKEHIKSFNYVVQISPTSFERVDTDGSKLVYSTPNDLATPTRVYLTATLDPFGNELRLEYDQRLRLVGLHDAIGQRSQILYEQPDPYLISRVVDPFGREARFTYDDKGRLATVIDMGGLSSKFSYGQGDFLTQFETPYGITKFRASTGGGDHKQNRYLWATDPSGETEHIYFDNPNEEDYVIPAVDPNPPPRTVDVGDSKVSFNAANARLHFRNTYYLDKNSYRASAGNATNHPKNAHIVHWLVTDTTYTVTGIRASEKPPLGNRVWYNFAGQGSGDESTHFAGSSSLPSKVARVQEDGSTKLTQAERNRLGKVTTHIDALGRKTEYLYSQDGIDLLEVKQAGANGPELLSNTTYNSRHMPLKVVDAAGQEESFEWNERGQPLKHTDANGDTTTYKYDARSYLVSIDGPLVGTNDLTTYAYDAFGRLSEQTSSDGYKLQYRYDNLDHLTNITYPDGSFRAFTYRNLDLVEERDREGRVSKHTYDAVQRLIQSEDPLRRTMRFSYCDCGALNGLTDAMGRKTSWDFDVEGKLLSKRYVDGATVRHEYESATGKKRSITDEAGQFVRYRYEPDGALGEISYHNDSNRTHSVTLQYDRYYPRVLSRTDGLGTTRFTYVPVGQLGALKLRSEDGPWENDTILYEYDKLGRVVRRQVAGAWEGFEFDAAGRVTKATNALGSFSYEYDGGTARLKAWRQAGGPRGEFEFYGNSGDHRLREIRQYGGAGAGASPEFRFGYQYRKEGGITNWVQELGGRKEEWAIEADAVEQLKGVKVNGVQKATPDFGFGYDNAGNMTSEVRAGTIRTFSHNALNQLISSSDSNLPSRVFEWDAEHRLTAIIRGSARTELFYDGEGRWGRILEKDGTNVVEDLRFTWCGLELCQERDAVSGQTVRFFGQGEEQERGGNKAALVYARDNLGSVRGVFERVGGGFQVTGLRWFEPFGKIGVEEGERRATRGFTGHYVHRRTGLVLAPFRAYDPEVGRWIARDPIREDGGWNLYPYVQNSPLNNLDRDGLTSEGAEVGAAFGVWLGRWAGWAVGGTAGAAVAGASSTFVAPGYGTVSGGLVGGRTGAWAGATIGAGAGGFIGYYVGDWGSDAFGVVSGWFGGHLHAHKGLPKGYWPADNGAIEWGRRHGVDKTEAKNRFHDLKDACNGWARDKWGVDPRNGAVVSPEGEVVGNLGDGK